MLALDVGSRRLGVAVSDPSRTLASPLATIERGSAEADAAALRRLAAEQGATLVVTGLPVALSGREELAARDVRADVRRLARLLPELEFELVDERLSTVVAERALAAQGVRGPARRRVIDQLAACVFLQTWLDQRSAPG